MHDSEHADVGVTRAHGLDSLGVDLVVLRKDQSSGPDAIPFGDAGDSLTV
jgi:hypothetical protein